MECHFNHTRKVKKDNVSDIKTEAECDGVGVDQTRFDINLTMPEVALCNDNQTWLQEQFMTHNFDRCQYWENRIGNAWKNESEGEMFLPNITEVTYVQMCQELATAATEDDSKYHA